jgi:hypothetical protein
MEFFFCAGSRNYNHLRSNIKDLPNDGKRFKTGIIQKITFWIIPTIAWRNILIKICNDISSFHLVINTNLAEL